MDKYIITVPKLHMAACGANGQILHFSSQEGARKYKDQLQIDIFTTTGKTYKLVITKLESKDIFLKPKLH